MRYLLAAAASSPQFSVTPAVSRVVVDHANRLHECVTNRRADKFEAAFQQIFAHGVRFRAASRQLMAFFPTIHLWFATDKSPNITVERSKLVLHIEKGLRIPNRRSDFQSVANDSRIRHQFRNFRFIIARDLLWIKAIERFAVILAL